MEEEEEYARGWIGLLEISKNCCLNLDDEKWSKKKVWGRNEEEEEEEEQEEEEEEGLDTGHI